MEISTAHYVFHCEEGSLAETEINKIADIQEGCYKFISSCLHAGARDRIHYHLYDTPEEVGRQYAIIHEEDEIEPCNGFALPENMSKDGTNHVFAVYNETVKCIGLSRGRAHYFLFDLQTELAVHKRRTRDVF